MIKQIGLPLRGRPILLVSRMITDRIGPHSVLLPLLIDRVEKFKLLGTWLSEDLKWTEHVNELGHIIML